jgi:hypothetical protein
MCGGKNNIFSLSRRYVLSAHKNVLGFCVLALLFIHSPAMWMDFHRFFAQRKFILLAQ